MRELPRFRYHSDPVQSRVFVRSSEACPCCDQVSGWAYDGPLYSLSDVDNLCPWCVFDGSAAARFHLEFVVAYEESASPEAVDELLHRTPGFFAAQEDPWPTHCNDFCSFLHSTNLSEILTLREELRKDLQTIRATLEISWKQLVEDLDRPHSPLWAHLFECVKCGQHRLVANYE